MMYTSCAHLEGPSEVASREGTYMCLYLCICFGLQVCRPGYWAGPQRICHCFAEFSTGQGSPHRSPMLATWPVLPRQLLRTAFIDSHGPAQTSVSGPYHLAPSVSHLNPSEFHDLALTIWPHQFLIWGHQNFHDLALTIWPHWFLIWPH